MKNLHRLVGCCSFFLYLVFLIFRLIPFAVRAPSSLLLPFIVSCCSPPRNTRIVGTKMAWQFKCFCCGEWKNELSSSSRPKLSLAWNFNSISIKKTRENLSEQWKLFRLFKKRKNSSSNSLAFFVSLVSAVRYFTVAVAVLCSVFLGENKKKL